MNPLRSLVRARGFALAAIFSLALGTAAVGIMFCLVRGVLLAPLPYAAPERLVGIGLVATEGRSMRLPPALIATWRQSARQVEAIGFHRTGNANLWIEGDAAAAERVVAAWVSEATLPLLGVAPLLGRHFTEAETEAGGRHAVILGEAEWRSRFGAAPDVIGRTLVVNSVAREIVGVMPAGFAFPAADARVWLPARTPGGGEVGDFAYSAVARLAPGASPAAAQAELARLLPALAGSFPRLASGGSTSTWLAEAEPRPVVVSLHEEVTGSVAAALRMLSAAAGLVLLVAWANVVNLMLVRTDARRHALAIRAALGAGRLRIAGHALGESLWLGALAGALALLAVHVAMRALVRFAPVDLPRLAELGVGWHGVAFIALTALLGAGVCLASGALGARRASALAGLGEGARAASAGSARQRLRNGIAVVQIALALVAVLGSALLLRTAARLHDVQPGFDADGVVVAWTQLPFARYDDAAAVAFYARLADAVAALPAVDSVGLTSRVPLGGGDSLTQAFLAEGGADQRMLPVDVVSAGYFATLRAPLLAGRDFIADPAMPSAEIILNARAAVDLFGDERGFAALGKRLALAPDGPAYTVVGVVADQRDRALASAPVPMLYRPQAVPRDPALEPGARRSMALVVRSNGATDTLLPAIRRIAGELDPAVPVFDAAPLDAVVRASTARLRLSLWLVSAAAAVTLLLGGIGLYGVMAYRVALRTRELGVRIALGADPARIVAAVARRGLALTALGVAVGFALYALAAPLLRAFLYGVTAGDPATLSAAAGVLLATGALASWLPARRAARIDPAIVLRAE